MLSRRKIEQYAKDREAKRAAQRAALLTPSRSLHRGTYGGGVSGEAVPKSQPYRDRALLDLAKDQPCLLLISGVCTQRRETTVAAHSNLSIHGKSGARKADDCYSVWACAACHAWLDAGKAEASLKEAAFQRAHCDQVAAWRWIATVEGAAPERFRNAARRALERLNATPIGDQP